MNKLENLDSPLGPPSDAAIVNRITAHRCRFVSRQYYAAAAAATATVLPETSLCKPPENRGRRTGKCFLFVDRMLEGFEMNKQKKFIENEQSRVIEADVFL